MGNKNKKRYKILLVDDALTNVEALRAILSPQYDILTAANGTTAIGSAVENSPDLIILDVVMPDIDGFEVIATLKKIETTSRIPVIFLTGMNDRVSEERGLMAGAVDYITKPFYDSIVKARVKTQIQILEYINTIERMCNVDVLTNIANRRAFEERMQMEWSLATRDRCPISVLMMDLDRFKAYNDTYGHTQGDNLIKTVASVMVDSLYRSVDFVARWGGEEFVALLYNTDVKGAVEVAERIRSTIKSTEIPLHDGTVTHVTISIGVNCTVPRVDECMKRFVDRADKALYLAKAAGRDSVVVHPDADASIGGC